jgi:hypothetical protein
VLSLLNGNFFIGSHPQHLIKQYNRPQQLQKQSNNTKTLIIVNEQFISQLIENGPFEAVVVAAVVKKSFKILIFCRNLKNKYS